jgi:hypothetical protein
MVNNSGNSGLAAAAKPVSGTRAAWTTPRVIVSDLGDARANSIIPGGDGCDPVFVSYCYGS